MNGRKELVDIILQADAEIDTRSFPDWIIDAILTRYAVVDLPEPNIAEGLNPEWSYDDSHRSRRVGLISGSEHEIAVGSGQFHTVDTARALAAALLAAANRAEARR